MILVSVIIPTYKPEHYLYECLESIAKQQYNLDYLEVIVVLNGPYEPFFIEIEQHSSRIGQINMRILYCEEQHVSSARNMGIEASRGRFLMFMDDDDLIAPEFIKDLTAKVPSNGIVCSNVLSFSRSPHGATKNYLSRTFDDNEGRSKPSWNMLRSHMSLVWGKLIPRTIIGNSRFDNNFKNGQDALFMALISSEIKEYALSSPSAIYYWRHRKNSASRKSNRISYEVKNTVLLMRQYCNIYFSKPRAYNILFFISRLLAVTKRLAYRLPKSRW